MKSVHQFSFYFKTDRLLKDFESIINSWNKHANTGYYEGEWSGIALREPVDKIHPLSTIGPEESIYKNTPLLDELPYFQEVLNYFECEKTSVRLLRLTPGSKIKEHTDLDLSFFHGNVRLHVPILTHEKIQFKIDGQDISMKPGECWFAEFCKPHSVSNSGETDRIHLVIDLKVNDWLRDLFENEGIIEVGEKAPDPIDSYSLNDKLNMIKSLRLLGSETSENMAQELIKKYNIPTQKIEDDY